MAGQTSFYYAIFKRLQAAAGTDTGHRTVDETGNDFAGGFSLRSTDNQYGIFGALGPKANTFGAQYKIQEGWQPLVAGNLVPEENPLYALLKGSLESPPLESVMVAGKEWPVMPLNPTADLWLEFNAGSPGVVAALGAWIAAGKTDDTPKPAPLSYSALLANPPALWPGLTVHAEPKPFTPNPMLFVCSMAHDDGRRHGDHGVPDVPLDHVPAHFWATSQIFLTSMLPGTAGTIVHPAKLPAGEEYGVAAIIGNSGNWPAGRLANFGAPNIHVRGDALAFNTSMSPNVPLPSLGNLHGQNTNATYEQYFLAPESYDVAGFRFDVDKVFAGLAQKLKDSEMDLGGISAEDWLKTSHPCVKVRITQGETPNPFTPEGGAALSINSEPRKDRHIAQRNLAPFDMTVMAAKKIDWKNFIVAQAGKGVNTLTLQHALPADFRCYLAVPKKTYERYVAKGLHGWEPTGRISSKPFPDAVILHPVAGKAGRAAHIEVAAHDKEPFLGMSLGIEGDPAKLKTVRRSDVAMVHAGPDGTVVGGFTLRPMSGKQ